MHPSTAAMQITKHRTPQKLRTKNILIKPTYEAISQRNLSVVQHPTDVKNGAKLSPEKAFPFQKMLVSYKLYWVTSWENCIFTNLDWSLRKTSFCGGTTERFIVTLVFLLLEIILFYQFPYSISVLLSTSLLALTQTSHSTPRLPSQHKQLCILIPDSISMLGIETYREPFYWFCLLSLLRLVSTKITIRMVNNIKQKTASLEGLLRSLFYFQNRNYR